MRNNHERFRELLALAAADALDVSEQQALERHVAECSACAAELEDWRVLGAGLKRLPTPMAPAALVERTRMQVEGQLAAESARRSSPWLIGFAILLSWTFAVGTWMVFKFLTAGALSWLDPAARQLWLGLTVYTLAGWAVGGIAAIGVGLRRPAARRTA